ncbi:MAG: hypothetical protein GWN01_01805, partial [Nitrosopumilaceae archaeon]|nr:hypothetical protein [Nitrosopumilaceae archaeon]NIU86099.1 hypothetical protein [Nitrosopumilaceae archaeon]NIX60310.1 hypothetical protein [Nitrosopumilaceae archaeon]
VDDPGSGYTTTPTITFSGGNGSGASARIVMTNGKVRTISIKAKWDRYEYESNVVEWEPDVSYSADQLVRINNV